MLPTEKPTDIGLLGHSLHFLKAGSICCCLPEGKPHWGWCGSYFFLSERGSPSCSGQSRAGGAGRSWAAAPRLPGTALNLCEPPGSCVSLWARPRGVRLQTQSAETLVAPNTGCAAAALPGRRPQPQAAGQSPTFSLSCCGVPSALSHLHPLNCKRRCSD